MRRSPSFGSHAAGHKLEEHSISLSHQSIRKWCKSTFVLVYIALALLLAKDTTSPRFAHVSDAVVCSFAISATCTTIVHIIFVCAT